MIQFNFIFPFFVKKYFFKKNPGISPWYLIRWFKFELNCIWPGSRVLRRGRRRLQVLGTGDGQQVQRPVLDRPGQLLHPQVVVVRPPDGLHVGQVPGQRVGLGEGEVVALVLQVEAEGEAEDEVAAVDRRLVVEHVVGGHALPPAKNALQNKNQA